MSVKELKQYEYKCDICGRIRRSNQLPSGWYQIDCLVKNNPGIPYNVDDLFEESYRGLREVKKTNHFCFDCAVNKMDSITFKPVKMFEE